MVIAAAAASRMGTWRDRLLEWFRELGFLDAAGKEIKATRDVQEFKDNPAGRRDAPGQPPAGDSLGLSDAEENARKAGYR
eukprot:COSAG05_NODE_61_length_23137_cov_22.080693_6_plen_80_part_00